MVMVEVTEGKRGVCHSFGYPSISTLFNKGLTPRPGIHSAAAVLSLIILLPLAHRYHPSPGEKHNKETKQESGVVYISDGDDSNDNGGTSPPPSTKVTRTGPRHPTLRPPPLVHTVIPNITLPSWFEEQGQTSHTQTYKIGRAHV